MNIITFLFPGNVKNVDILVQKPPVFSCEQKLKFWLHKTRSYSWQNWILSLERDCPILNLYVHDFYLTFLNAFVSSHKLKYIGMIVFVCSSETLGQVLMKLAVRVSL